MLFKFFIHNEFPILVNPRLWGSFVEPLVEKLEELTNKKSAIKFLHYS